LTGLKNARWWSDAMRRKTVARGIVHLTPEGRKLIKKAFTRHAAEMERATSRLNESERRTLLRLLKKLGYGAGGTRGSRAQLNAQ
jgi:hypothetical protein